MKSNLTLALCLATASVAHAQTTPKVTILLDPAHGGSDLGAHLASDSAEKDATAALAQRLRPLLVAQGFNVILTREPDTEETASAPPLTPDQRAEIANHAHPIACLLLHATTAGRGVHLFTSSLVPLSTGEDMKPILPWATAQAAQIPQSLRLVNEITSAMNSAHIPFISGRASVAPIDSLACPAVLVEVGPRANGSGSPPASNPDYQQTVSDAIVNALLSWRQHQEEPAASDKPGDKPGDKTGDAR